MVLGFDFPDFWKVFCFFGIVSDFLEHFPKSRKLFQNLGQYSELSEFPVSCEMQSLYPENRTVQTLQT